MKFTKEFKQLILNYAETGMTSRAIARALDCSKSAVNNVINKSINKVELQYNPTDVAFKKQGPRILFFDLETAAALAYTFGRFKVNLSQDSIHTEGGWIICASYKWLGEKEVHTIAYPMDVQYAEDDRVTDDLWRLFDQADAVVAHNALAFDVKMLQARCMVNGLPPLPTVKVIDTLQMAKKNFRLPNNKLDSIVQLLGLGAKLDTGGISLWKEAQQGDAGALAKMVAYCKHDTALLEQVYLRLRSFGTASNFNAANYYADSEVRCPVCGSTDIEPTIRSVFTDVSKFEEMRCNDCGSVHRKRKPVNTKEKRSSLLAAAKI